MDREALEAELNSLYEQIGSVGAISEIPESVFERVWEIERILTPSSLELEEDYRCGCESVWCMECACERGGCPEDI